MNLISVPKQKFNLDIKEYKPKKQSYRCPATPTWVSNLVKHGMSLNLEPIIIQTGRHFADSLNSQVFPGSSTRRQEATKLAWQIISMLNPSVQSGNLIVTKPIDRDISRLAAEIIGVGGGLELLRKAKQIDARTLRKISGRFDFEGNTRKGSGRVLIEAKGTMDHSSLQAQRASFLKKLTNQRMIGSAARGYSSAVGVIFSTWSDFSARKHDVELLDPEGEFVSHEEEAIREIIGSPIVVMKA